MSLDILVGLMVVLVLLVVGIYVLGGFNLNAALPANAPDLIPTDGIIKAKELLGL